MLLEGQIMRIWNWYDHLMGNNLVLIIGVALSVVVINWWVKQEEKWKENNNYSIGKRILKVIGIILIGIFGLPGIIIFFGSI
jgi:uncharacterized membrane protein